jgi:hypothetical protein
MGKDMALCLKKKIRKAVDMEGRIKPRVVSRSLIYAKILKRGTIIDAKGTIMDRSSIAG